MPPFQRRSSAAPQDLLGDAELRCDRLAIRVPLPQLDLARTEQGGHAEHDEQRQQEAQQPVEDGEPDDDAEEDQPRGRDPDQEAGEELGEDLGVAVDAGDQRTGRMPLDEVQVLVEAVAEQPLSQTVRGAPRDEAGEPGLADRQQRLGAGGDEEEEGGDAIFAPVLPLNASMYRLTKRGPSSDAPAPAATTRARRRSAPRCGRSWAPRNASCSRRLVRWESGRSRADGIGGAIVYSRPPARPRSAGRWRFAQASAGRIVNAPPPSGVTARKCRWSKLRMRLVW